MQKIILFFCLLPVFSFAQNSYTVSNVAGATANYKTLQGAIDSVAAGSTLYVFPSDNDYGNININKKLLIVGTGFMLDQNSEPFTAPNKNGVMLSSVYFMPGSSDSYMQGIQLIGNTNENRFFRFFLDSVNNVTINRCFGEIWRTFPGGNIVIETRNTNNCTFSQCYLTQINLEFTNHSGGEFYIELGTGSQNLQFNNNLFDNRGANLEFTLNHNINPTNYGNVIFTNNTFHGLMRANDFCDYSYFNNFFVSVDTTTSVSPTTGLNGPTGFNITNVRNLFPGGSNNIQVAGIDSLFAYSTFGYHSWDQSWQLNDNSFAKQYANDGGEVGVFGGYHPYVLSGIPALPEIYNLTLAPDAKNRGHVLVRIKAKSTN